MFRIDGAHGVDHPFRWEAAGGRGYRLPCRKPVRIPFGPDPLALLEDLRSASPMNGSVHSAPTHQRRVGRVDDGIGELLGDVALDQRDARHGVTPATARRPRYGAGSSL